MKALRYGKHDRHMGQTIASMAAAVTVSLSGQLMASESDHVTVTPEAAMARLQEGNERFISGRSTETTKSDERRAEVAQKQHPFAIVVCCSDSRVGPEVVFDQGLGDIFVIRTAGEVVDDVGLGSIEYGVEHLGASLIVVLGHERCGAVSAAIGGGEAPGHLPAVLNAIQPAVAAAKDEKGDTVENTVRAQVRSVVGQLQHSEPVLTEFIKSEKLKIVGARYDLDNGHVEILE